MHTRHTFISLDFKSQSTCDYPYQKTVRHARANNLKDTPVEPQLKHYFHCIGHVVHTL